MPQGKKRALREITKLLTLKERVRKPAIEHGKPIKAVRA